MMKLDQPATKENKSEAFGEIIVLYYTKKIQQTFSYLEVMPHFTIIANDFFSNHH